MKPNFVHNPFFRLLAPLVYGVLAYLFILLINNNVAQVNDLFSSQEVYICVALTYLSFESIRLTIRLLDRHVDAALARLRIVLQILATTSISALFVYLGLQLYFQYYEGFSISIIQLTIFLTIYSVAAILYNILYLSNHYLQKENTAKLAAERQYHADLEVAMIEFKNDINPELLFESLESLINLMYNDVEKAEEHIDCLASAYRYVLRNRQDELVPLEIELTSAHNLVMLLNQSHFGQLRLESSLDPVELKALLIPGSLAVIIESMIRNTIISPFEPLTVRCYLEDDYITIQTKLNDRLKTNPNSEAALLRLQKSYSFYSDQPMIKVKAYEENYIKLPVIQVAEEMIR
jgi:hypothetical protein